MTAGILIVRLGAMGDILHALPAVASLRLSFPDQPISWLLAPRWMPLLEGNPAIDRLIPFERRSLRQLRDTWQRLRPLQPARAFDFQGLLQSAIAGRLSRPQQFWGFSRDIVRERWAASFYDHPVRVQGTHRIERNLNLVKAAGASEQTLDSWLPPGQPDSSLPVEPFVLASPFAGWPGKEWPLPNYAALARLLQRDGLRLVLNVPTPKAEQIRSLPGVHVHSSSLGELIFATRQAAAVLGVDSGPTHLAAALHKPGVAIYGPTDPAATGPFGPSMTVLRAPGTTSTYKRGRETHSSMHAITVEQVHSALLASCQSPPLHARQAGHPA